MINPVHVSLQVLWIALSRPVSNKRLHNGAVCRKNVPDSFTSIGAIVDVTRTRSYVFLISISIFVQQCRVTMRKRCQELVRALTKIRLIDWKRERCPHSHQVCTIFPRHGNKGHGRTELSQRGTARVVSRSSNFLLPA